MAADVGELCLLFVSHAAESWNSPETVSHTQPQGHMFGSLNHLSIFYRLSISDFLGFSLMSWLPLLGLEPLGVL